MPTKGINSAIVALEIELLRFEQMLDRSVSNNEVFLKQLNYYSRCVFPLDTSKGAHLLMESTLQGDATAAHWLDELNAKQ